MNDLPRKPAKFVPGLTGPRVGGSLDGKTWPAGPDPKGPAFWSQLSVFDLSEPSRRPARVFGQYPAGFLAAVLPLLRAPAREVLHVCSGSLSREATAGGLRIDLRRTAAPDLVADGRRLPLRSGSVSAVLLDPPYTVDYARRLYGTGYPRPAHLLEEAARVVKPCGRIGVLHLMVPYTPPNCSIVRIVGVSTGCGYQLRAFTVYERAQEGLPWIDS